MEHAVSYLVWSALRSSFARPALHRAWQALATRCGPDLPGAQNPELLERIQLAVLKLAGGDEARLASALDLAETDWRDVLVAAGFGHDVTAHLRWATDTMGWASVAPPRPSECGTWVQLTAPERDAWLFEAAARALGRYAGTPRRPDAPAHTTFVLPGRLITSLDSFFCAVGESVNGPGGYFGASLVAFEDCLMGGFGASRPSTFRWLDAQHARSHMGHDALASWASQRIAEHDFLDEDGKVWLLEALAHARLGKGPTLFEHITDLIAAKGHVVELVD